METAIEKAEKKGLVPAFDMSTLDLPDLTEAREVPADLISEYWSPETEGEYKLVFFQRIEESTCLDQNTGEEIQLPCAFLLEQKEDRSLQVVRNGSIRLVKSLEYSLEKEQIAEGTPMKVTFEGRKKNKTNMNLSDRWSIRPLSA